MLVLFAVRRGDRKTVLVISDGHDLVHVLDHPARHADSGGDRFVPHALHAERAHVEPHRGHAFQRVHDGLLVPRRQHVGEVFDGNAQRPHVGHLVAHRDLSRLSGVLDRAERRYIPHHRQRPVFRVQREGDLPIHRHLPDRADLGCLDPVLGHAVAASGGDHLGVVRIEEHIQLRTVEIGLALGAGRRLDLVGVIKDHTQVANAPDAGFRTDRGLAGLDPRIAEGAFLGLTGIPVVIDLLVRTARDAHPPAAALLLVDQDDAVLFALVDRARGTGGGTGGVKAVLAQARQIHHEGVFILSIDILLHLIEVVVLRALRELAAEDFLPVRALIDLLHPLAGDLRAGPRGRERSHVGRGLQVVVVEIERLVVVVDLGHGRVGEDVRQDPPFRPLLGMQLARGRAHPAAVPALLVLPVRRIAGAGLRLDVVEPRVFDTFARRPHVLAGDRAGVTPDAFVEVQDLADLRTNSHSAASTFWVADRLAGLSSQSIFFIFRTITNSSRLLPTVP